AENSAIVQTSIADEVVHSPITLGSSKEGEKVGAITMCTSAGISARVAPSLCIHRSEFIGASTNIKPAEIKVRVTAVKGLSCVLRTYHPTSLGKGICRFRKNIEK